MSWEKFVILTLAILIMLDGIGSIIIQYGQYHSITFDLERFGRVIVGLIIAIIAWKEMD